VTAARFCADNRLRALPIARAAVVAGHIFADLVRSGLGVIVTIGAGIAVGFHPHAGIGGFGKVLAGRTDHPARILQQRDWFLPARCRAGCGSFSSNQPGIQAVDALRALLLNPPISDPLLLAMAEFAEMTIVAGGIAGMLFQRSARQPGTAHPSPTTAGCQLPAENA
jgi:ABC-2 type transport system permease protein